MPTKPTPRCVWPRCPNYKPCPTHRHQRTTPQATQQARGYGNTYRKQRTALLNDNPTCWWCGQPATTADHIPPLRTAPTPAEWQGALVPACTTCQNRHIPERGDP